MGVDVLTYHFLSRYGVARVYSQQCGYVLADAQAVRDKVRGVSMIIKEVALDPEAGRAKSVEFPWQYKHACSLRVGPISSTYQMTLPSCRSWI